MSSPPGRPARVAVSHPRRSAGHRPPRPRGRTDVEAGTSVGEFLVRSLIRAQLLLALRTILALAVVLGGVPLVFAVFPDTRTVEVLGIPVPWLGLGVLAFPFLIALGAWHIRGAEQHERDYLELRGRDR